MRVPRRSGTVGSELIGRVTAFVVSPV
jgi:hypothetical protein